MIAYRRFDLHMQNSIDITEDQWNIAVDGETTMHFELGNAQVDTYYGYSELEDDHFIYQRIILT